MTTVIDKDKFTKIAQITIVILIVAVLLALLIFFLTHKGKKTSAPIIHAPNVVYQLSKYKEPITNNDTNLDQNNKSKTEQSDEEKISKINNKNETLISSTLTQTTLAQVPKRPLTSKDLNGFFKSEMEITIKAITFDETAQQWNFEIEDSKNHINEIPYGWSSWGLLGYKSRPTNIEQDLLDVEFVDFILDSTKNTSEANAPTKRDKLINFIKLILITKKLNSEEMTEFCQILNSLEPQKSTPTQQQKLTNQPSVSSEGSFHSTNENLDQQSTDTTTPGHKVDDSTINRNSSNIQKD